LGGQRYEISCSLPNFQPFFFVRKKIIRNFASELQTIVMMKIHKEKQAERILLDDDMLEEVVGGAQSAHRPSWFRGS
jgi:hypothetical protein